MESMKGTSWQRPHTSSGFPLTPQQKGCSSFISVLWEIIILISIFNCVCPFLGFLCIYV